MIIDLRIIEEFEPTNNEEVGVCHFRNKKYESDYLDDDMINSPTSHKIDRVILSDVQITTIDQIEKLKIFLDNLKPTLNV